MQLYWNKFHMKDHVIITKTQTKTSNTTTNPTKPNNIGFFFLFLLNILKPDALKDEISEKYSSGG